ncbi:hypothetical protein JTB14_008692 [Gonioctena quinquepunctata]|nr:hypothetical protein JTB14_008692 [Gonioctena quinquepunctata]
MYPLNAFHIKAIERLILAKQLPNFNTTDQQENEGEKTEEKTVNATQELEKKTDLERNLKGNNEKKNQPEITNQGNNDKNRETQDVYIPTSSKNIVDVEPSIPSMSGFNVCDLDYYSIPEKFLDDVETDAPESLRVFLDEVIVKPKRKSKDT